MYVARILYPIEVLGPGKRIGIWFCGCPHKCKGCSNPELWDFRDKYNVALETVMALVTGIVKDNQVDGFTITGGDPMYQAEDLQQLVTQLCGISSDILVYTGYKIEELPEKYLNNISVLIDGKYIEERNNNCILRGSDNQKIHILDSEMESKYSLYLQNASSRIQNFSTSDGIISVGIHKPKFIEDLNDKMAVKGLTGNTNT